MSSNLFISISFSQILSVFHGRTLVETKWPWKFNEKSDLGTVFLSNSSISRHFTLFVLSVFDSYKLYGKNHYNSSQWYFKHEMTTTIVNNRVHWKTIERSKRLFTLNICVIRYALIGYWSTFSRCRFTQMNRAIHLQCFILLVMTQSIMLNEQFVFNIIKCIFCWFGMLIWIHFQFKCIYIFAHFSSCRSLSDAFFLLLLHLSARCLCQFSLCVFFFWNRKQKTLLNHTVEMWMKNQ